MHSILSFLLRNCDTLTEVLSLAWLLYARNLYNQYWRVSHASCRHGFGLSALCLHDNSVYSRDYRNAWYRDFQTLFWKRKVFLYNHVSVYVSHWQSVITNDAEFNILSIIIRKKKRNIQWTLWYFTGKYNTFNSDFFRVQIHVFDFGTQMNEPKVSLKINSRKSTTRKEKIQV